MSDATACAPSPATPDFTNELLHGMDVEVYVKALDRFHAEPEYAAALNAWLETLPDLEYTAPEFLQSRIGACRGWPILRAALERKSAAALARPHMHPEYRWLILDPPPAGDGDWEMRPAEFRCPKCNRWIAILAWGIHDRTLACFDFSHKDYDYKGRPCEAEDYGDDYWLEWLGLSAFTEKASFDLSFLDGEDAGQEREPDWLIPGMFARGDYWSLFGPSEVGKSLLALDWSLRMARTGQRVLYLDRENSREVLQQRLKKMGAQRADFANLLLMPFVDIADLATEKGATELHELVRKHSATVVVLDTISKFSEVGQAVQSDRWQKMYNHSFVPLLNSGVSVGQLDHTGLGDKTRERDSNAKRDNVSIAWALTWRGKDRLTLTRAKNRPNYSSPSSVAVERVDEPFLTHSFGKSEPDEIRAALEELERLNVPRTAGRDAAREILTANGVSMANDLLAAAIRARKAA